MYKNSFMKRVLSLLLAVLILPLNLFAQTVFASENQLNTALLDYLKEAYGEETAVALSQNLLQMGLIDENGNFRSYQVEYNDKQMSLDEIKEILNASDVDLSQTCKVDGQEITLGDLKTIIGIEEELSRIESTYFSKDVEMTQEHQDMLNSLIAQLSENGVDFYTQPTDEQDNAAMALGYKSQLARISVTASDVTVNQGDSVTFTFNLSKALDYAVSFDYTTLDGSASAGKHFEAASGTVTFAPQETQKTITVKTNAVNNLAGQNASAEQYRTDRWEGTRNFLIKCYNPKNILFDSDKNSMSLKVNINGNYDYDVYFMNGNLIHISDKYNAEPGNDGWGNRGPLNIAPLVRFTNRYPNISESALSYTVPFVQNGIDFREYVREGLVTHFYSSVTYYPGVKGKIYLAVPGTNSLNSGNTNIVAQSSTINDSKMSLKYDLSSIKSKLLSADSLTFGYNIGQDDYLGNYFYNEGDFLYEKDFSVVDVTAPSGTYYPGDVVPITITYSEPVVNAWGETFVTISGTNINSSAADETRSYQHTFLYTVPENPTAKIQISGLSARRFYAECWWMSSEIKKYTDTTSRTIEGVTLSKESVQNTFTSVSVDKDIYSPKENTANITVNIDKEFSQWLEQGEEYKRVKASIDGGKTFIALSLSGDGATMTGSAILPEYLDEQNHSMRVELYVDGNCILGKYDDFTVEPVVFVKESDMSIDYPGEWPSGKEDVVYLTADTSTQLKYSYTGNATYPDFEWSSNNPEIAQISEDGTILPVTAGEVTFTLTATNADKCAEKNVSLQTRTITISPGGEPALTIPSDLSKIYVVQGNDAKLFWSTNVIYKNQNDITPPVSTYFTVKLYEGYLEDNELASQTPLKTYTDSSEYPLCDVTSFTIPKEDIDKISVNDEPSYTVTVQVKHPLNDSILTAKAYIIVNSPAAVVKMEKPSNIYLLDNCKSIPVKWDLTHFDSKNEGEFEFTVTRNDTLIKESVITYDPQTGFNFGMEQAGDEASYTGHYDIPVTQVSDGTLYDLYTVNVKAKNKNESTWSYDSLIFYVYNRNALDIVVDSQKQDDIYMSNVADISGMSSSEILALNRDINLGKTISINYGDYAWAAVTDKIKWMASDSSVASINYQQGGLYDSIENYSYTTYRPSENFILSGLKDGQTTITAVHDATRMTSAVNVTVETLKDKLYIFQVSPKTKTEVLYTDKNGEQKTVYTDENGALALYEPNGIKGDVSLKSEYNGKTYIGTFVNGTLESGEEDASKMGLYPVNNIKLREPANLEFYLKKPDGTPYTGELTYRGGVYKNGEYCQPSEISGEGQTVTIGNDGKLNIQMDVTKFWVEGNQTELKATDELEFVFEVIFPDNTYQPVLLTQNSRLNSDDLISTAAASCTLTEAQEKTAFIAKQTYSNGVEGAVEKDILGYSGKFGPNANMDNIQLTTTVLWWGEDTEEFADASVKLKDEFGTVPTGQSYKTFKYPFGTMLVTEHTQLLNKDTIWMNEKYSRGIQYQLNKNESEQYKTLPISFRVVNMLNAPKVEAENSGTTSILVTLKDSMVVDGGSMSLGDSFIGAGLNVLEATSFSLPFFTMQISATEDPTCFNVLIEAGKGNVDDIYVQDYNEDENGGEDFSYTPGLSEVRSMLKGEYLKEQEAELKEKANKNKYGDGSLLYNVTGYYEGQVVYNYEKGKWETIIQTGGFNVGGGYGYQWTYNSSVGPIPVTAELGLGAAVSVDFNVKALYEERTYNNELLEWKDSVSSDYVTDYLSTLRLYAYMNAFGGLGFDYSVVALKIGLFGQIGLDNQNTWLNREYLKNESLRKLNGQSLTLAGQVGIRFYAKFLFVSYEKILASAYYSKTWIYNNWDKIYDYWEKTTGGKLDDDNIMQAAAAYMIANPQLITLSDTAAVEDRDYLSYADRTWNSNTDVSFFALDDENKAPAELQTNAYPHANPKLTDDGKMFVYLSDSSSKDVERTSASYAVYSGSGYQDCGAIPKADTGYGDSGLNVSGTGDYAAAVWVEQKASIDKDAGDTITSAEQALLANGAEIAVSIYQNGNWTTKRLTDNSTPDLAPVVSVSDDSIVVAWRSVVIGNENNVTDFSASDKILCVRYDRNTGEWTDPITVYNGTSGNVMGLELATQSDGTAGIVYTLDKTDESQVSTSENYEIVYSVIDANQQVVKNQQITNDSCTDENPHITTVKIDEEEQFLIAWYRVEQEENNITKQDTALTTQSDIRMELIDNQGIITTSEYGFADSLTQASGGQNISVQSNFDFVLSQSRELEDLSLIWASFVSEESADEQDTSTKTGVLYSVRFARENQKVHTSAVIEIARMSDDTIIDSFSAYSSADNEVKAMILGSYTSGYEDSGEVVYDPAQDKEVPLNVPVSISGMYTATGTYKNSFAIDGIDTELDKVVCGLPLPIKFTVSNLGISRITSARITVGDDVQEFNGDELSILPNNSAELVVNYTVPDDEVVDPEYKVEVFFNDGTSLSENGDIRLTVPDIGISKITSISQADGQRDFTVSLYNGSASDLAGSGQTVKLAFYTDNTYTTMIENGLQELEISDDTQLALIDSGAYTKQFTFNIKDFINSKDYDEIPESGIPVYVKAWIEKDSKQVSEYNSNNNINMVQFYGLDKDLEKDTPIKDSVLLNIEDGAQGKITRATVMLQNMKMQTLSDWNAVVNLLDENGDILQTKYIATSDSQLLNFNSEEVISKEIEFDQAGNSVEVIPFKSSKEAMNADLSALTASGTNLSLSENVFEYNVNAENITQTTITAVASNSLSTVEIFDAQGISLQKSTGSASVLLPLQYTSIDGVSTSRTNRFTVVVTAQEQSAQPKTYTVNIENNQKTNGTLSVTLPERNASGWIVLTDNQKISITAQGGSAQQIEYSFDTNTWTEIKGTQADVTLPENDGIYTLYARAKTADGSYITVPGVTVRIDRTKPQFNGDVVLEATDIPLEKESGLSSLFSLFDFGIATKNQVKVTVDVSDELSGIKSVYAVAGDNTYPMTDNGDGTYSAYITRAYEGDITVSVEDMAGNIISKNSAQVLIDSAVTPIQPSSAVSNVTQDSADINISAVFEKDEYFDYVKVSYKPSGTDTWTEVKTISDAQQAKDCVVNINSLNNASQYDYKVEIKSVIKEDAPVVLTGQFYTARQAPNAPEVESKTSDTITLKKVDGAVYRCQIDKESDTWTEWTDNPVFENLNPGSEYTFEVKFPQSGSVPESSASSAVFATYPLYNVVFDKNTDDSTEQVPQTQQIKYGESALAPKDEPERSGYTFTGWYTDKECNDLYDFTQPVTADINLYAGWSENVVTENDYIVEGELKDGWYNENVVIKPSGDYTEIWNGTAWADSMTVRNGKEQNVSFKLRKQIDGEYVETTMIHTPLTMSVDTDAPQAQIVLSENTLRKVLNKITFGLFFKDTVTAKIKSSDEISGVKEVEYLISEKELTLDELKASDKWIKGNKAELESEGRYIVYAHVTDYASNEVYINTQGVVVDKTLPVITADYKYDGEWTVDSNAAIYVKAQEELSDIKQVVYQINGEEFTSDKKEFSIENLPDGNYDVIITAEDNAGNVSAPVVVCVMKETLKPVLKAELNTESSSDKTAVIDLIYSADYPSGVTLYVSKDGGEQTQLPENAVSYTVNENGKYTFTLVTGAGQQTTAEITVDLSYLGNGVDTGDLTSNTVIASLFLMLASGAVMAMVVFKKKKQ